ncbi:MAG: AraC family transcriptional regulator, partial [Caulobacterales bacterium]|nr:AraC family transcriptional regulator [Caulobacterales bacterium]
MTPAQCLEGTGLEAFELYGVDATVSKAQELAAIENFLSRTSKRVGLGLEIGRRYQTSVFGIWGYAILSSPTMRAGLRTAIDFANLSFVLAPLGLDEDDDPPTVTFDTSGLSPAVKGFVLERQTTVIANFQKELFPSIPLSTATFKTTLSCSAFAHAMEDTHGVRVDLNCAGDAIVLSS